MSVPRAQLEKLAKKFGTPLYVYDIDAIVKRLNEFRSCFRNDVEIHYALKANANNKILKSFKKNKIGVDVVSWGEARVAVEAGFRHDDIIFSGVGKTSDELSKAIKYKIKQINVESPQELSRIGEIAKKQKKKAQVAFRVNPNVNPQTHPYITTGFRENKFGMDVSFLPELRGILTKYKKNIELKGVTIHIGSQILDLNVLREAIQKTIPIFLDLKNSYSTIETFDVGGGLGINYDGKSQTNFKDYAKMIEELLAPLGCRILCEPGRILVGEFGYLISEVQYIKKTPYKNFAIIDTGMNHLIRPALYNAVHRIEALCENKNESELYDIVGPVCESSDFLGKDRFLPKLSQGDLLVILDVGAYGYSMASNYNHHGLPKEVALNSIS